MKENSARHFSNTSCAYYPCHKGADAENFNCLFCYCPLYALGEKCGGNFHYTDKGIKDCTDCTLPHDEDGYDHVMRHIKAVLELGKRP
jgi:Zn-finger protein